MPTRIHDSAQSRCITVDARNKGCPDSVFISGPRGLCMEFDLRDFVDALTKEFGFPVVRLARAA